MDNKKKTDTSAQRHHHTVDEIRNLGDIAMTLSNLIDRIEPNPTESEGKDVVDPGYPGLRKFLETAPEDLSQRREHMLKQIGEIEELLFN